VTFAFELNVLPLLQDMARNPLASDYPITIRMLDLGLVDDGEQADRLLELLRDDGYVTFRGQQNGAGDWALMYDVRPTPKALKQLDLWPADNERGLYLLRRIAAAYDAAASDVDAESGADTERAGRLRAAATSIRDASREVGTEIIAKVIANTVTGGG
jgi:hypothetical protein